MCVLFASLPKFTHCNLKKKKKIEKRYFGVHKTMASNLTELYEIVTTR